MILPNLNEMPRTEGNGDSAVAVTPQMKAVLTFLGANGTITEEQVQELLGVRRTLSLIHI